jgi:hypothetical protein
LFEDAHSLHCHLHQRRWLGEGLDLNNVILVQRLEAVNGSLQCRHGLCQLCLCGICNGLSLLLHGFDILLLCCHHHFDLFCFLLVSRYLFKAAQG